MTVVEIAPDVDRAALLAGAQFMDAYSIAVDGGALDARHAAERMITRQPPWAEALLTLRNILVRPFGLKTSGASKTASQPRQRNIQPRSAHAPLWSHHVDGAILTAMPAAR